ncbi:transcriptional regulator ATRX-like [Mya arenaria]|uniref:transcriptional regulator ATRX-like n=1 Tax=Mya arenaria TaxID=6604 RepID=UPI0022E474B4|nr:transcriptional regulator ATRX-like [Mya arenaria]
MTTCRCSAGIMEMFDGAKEDIHFSVEAKTAIKELKNTKESKQTKYKTQPPKPGDKPLVVKVPGKKAHRREQRKRDRFSSLSLARPPDKPKVVKVPGTGATHRRRSDIETSGYTSGESATKEYSGRKRVIGEKAKIIKKPGLSLRERKELGRSNQSSSNDFYGDSGGVSPRNKTTGGNTGLSSSSRDTPSSRRTSELTLRERRTQARLEKAGLSENEEERVQRRIEEQENLEKQIADLLNRNSVKKKGVHNDTEVSNHPPQEYKKKKRDIRAAEYIVNNLKQQKLAEESYNRKKLIDSNNNSRNSQTSRDLQSRNTVPSRNTLPDRTSTGNSDPNQTYVERSEEAHRESRDTKHTENEVTEEYYTRQQTHQGPRPTPYQPGYEAPIHESLEEMGDTARRDEDLYEDGGRAVRGYEEEGYYDDQQGYGVQDDQEDNREEEYDNYDEGQHGSGRLPPIDDNRKRKQQDQTSWQSYPGRKPVYERLYDPNYRDRRSLPTRPETVYYRDFKSRPPKNLGHVKSKFNDPSYYEPRGEYVLETEDPEAAQFRSKPPKELEHVQSRILNPEYQKKKEPAPDSSTEDRAAATFHARLPQHLGHVQPKIYDARYYQERQQEEEEVVRPEFRSRPPKRLENVQSRIMDPKYFQEKPKPEEEKIETEFRSRPPKKLEHVQSRILEPRKQKPPPPEEDSTSPLPTFRSKPPKNLEHVSSRILDPAYYTPKTADMSQDVDEDAQHEFKARLPNHLSHVESRVNDPRYLKKRTSIPRDEQEAQAMNTDFKARPPKALQHVQSRFFDPYYNKQLSPRDTSLVELKQKGPIVVINVKKTERPHGYKDRLERARAVQGAAVMDKENFNEFRESKEKRKGDLTPRWKEAEPEKKEVKRWRPPKKPKPEKIDRQFFDTWEMTPTHVITPGSQEGDMFSRNRQEVAEMWTDFSKSVKRSGIRNTNQRSTRTYY